MTSTLFVCITCRTAGAAPSPADAPRPGARMLAALDRELGDADISAVAVECLSNCSRGCSVAVGAPGKWTYIVGNLDPDHHAADLATFARLHRAHEQGVPTWRDRPEHVRKNTIARVPPMIAKETV